MKLTLGNLPPRKSIRGRRRVGRGHGSGWVKTAGRGQKGQHSRSGESFPGMFIGGALGLSRRMPKLGGFKPIGKIVYAPVNLNDLNRFEPNADVTPDTLREAGVIRARAAHVKLLAMGEIKHAVTIHVHAASQTALRKMEAAGGTVFIIGGPQEPAKAKPIEPKPEKPPKAEKPPKEKKDKKDKVKDKDKKETKEKKKDDAAAPAEKKPKKEKKAKEEAAPEA